MCKYQILLVFYLVGLAGTAGVEGSRKHKICKYGRLCVYYLTIRILYLRIDGSQDKRQQQSASLGHPTADAGSLFTNLIRICF